MSPRVFVPQIPTRLCQRTGERVPKFDTLGQAEEFGDLVVLLGEKDQQWAPDPVMAALKRGLRDYSKDDYFLPMGNHHFMFWAGCIIAARVGTVRSLQWHNRDREYKVIETRIFNL